jgi:TolB-like protein/class 3 adenylate cyclase
MFTDMVGYTALGQRNESLSLALVGEQRKLIRPILTRHNGREIKTMGDAFLVEFPNATDSVRCAYDIQRAIREFNLALVSDKRIHLRIGIHLGEVFESQGDISGDAVNVVSRIYPLAEDGGVCLTRQVYDQVSNKTDLQMASIGVKPLKNVSAPIEVYKMEMPWEQPTPSTEAVTLPRDRIAILPFANFSPDPNDEYFANGMTEEIISTVSTISGLSVISRTSVMKYKGTNKSVEEIGRELKVGSILEGSFRKAGNRIRVTTQLIEVAGDKHLWVQNYDRSLDDVFQVQSDVAKQVADALRVRILAPEKERISKRPTENTAAYTLYLKGRYLWNKRGLEDMKEAARLFEQATREDPSFALGYVGQADSYLVIRSNWGIDRDSNLQKAKHLVARALELDPDLAEAHASRGLMLEGEYEFTEAEEEFKRAIELKPNYSMAHMWYHQVLGAQLRWNEALSQIEKTLELDPLSPVANSNLADYYQTKREYGRALELHRRAAELGAYGSHFAMAICYGNLRMFDEMRRELTIHEELLRSTFPDVTVARDGAIAYFEGDNQALERLLPQMETRLDETGLDAFTVAFCYFHIGNDAKGFEWLGRSYSRREGALLGIQVQPDLDRVRNDPRYLNLLKRLGLS